MTLDRVLAVVLGVALTAAAAVPAGAEVKLEVRPDGTKVMVNTTVAARNGHHGGQGADGARAAVLAAANRRAEERARWSPVIEEHSQRHGLDPRLVAAVVEVESAYRPRARSHKGAIGLMQLMPATAAQLAVDDPYDPEQNVRGGVAYLASMVDRFGSLELALAAYNAGPEAVSRYNGVPPYRETRDYVARVLRIYDGRQADLRATVPGGGTAAPRGRKPYIVREAGGRVVLTTDPP